MFSEQHKPGEDYRESESTEASDRLLYIRLGLRLLCPVWRWGRWWSRGLRRANPEGFKGGRRGAVAKELREQCISEDYKGGKQKKLGRGSRSARTPTGPEEATREKRYRSSSLSLSLKCHTSVLGKCFYLRCIIEYSENTAHSASRSRNVS